MYQAEVSVPKAQIDRVVATYQDQLFALIRYERFRQGESVQEWVDLLGPDVIGLTHADVTAVITQMFIAYNKDNGVMLSFDKEALLMTTPWVHDWGELKIEGHGVGDVTFEQRTTADAQVEHEIFERIVRDLPDESLREFMRQAYEVTMTKDSELGRMFNAIERLGYLQTAVRAFMGVDVKRIRNWRGLVGNVLSNQIETLLAYRKEYPYVNYLLQSFSETITRMFDDVLAESIPLDGEGNASYDLQKLQKARLAWNATS